MDRVLRLALIHANRIVEDRSFPLRAKITIGRAVRSTFIVPVDDFPECFTLFEDLELRWPKEATGRLCLSASEQPLSDFVSAQVSLPHTATGRLQLNDVTVVFHFVEAPKALPPLPMPRELKGSVLAQIDRAFLGVLAASLVAHFTGASWLLLQPLPPDEELSMEALVPDRFARQHLPPMPAPPKAALDPRPPEPNGPTATKPRPAPAALAVGSHRDVRAQVAHLGLLNVLGARSEGNAGLDEVLSNFGSTSDVAQALTGVTNLRFATADDLTASQPHGAQVGEATTISGLVTKGEAPRLTLHEAAQAQVQGRAQSEGPLVGPHTDLRSDELATWMKSRTPAIQSCYEHELKRNRSLHGRLVVRFSITPRGRTSNVGIEENTLGTDEVGRCISSLISHWVLPFTPDDEVSVSFPWVFSPVN
jgi:hypothetical protein